MRRAIVIKGVNASIPQNFGEYKLLQRIGSGRMAGVYKAVHPLGQTVAIKVLPDAFAQDPDRLARFTREAQRNTMTSIRSWKCSYA